MVVNTLLTLLFFAGLCISILAYIICFIRFIACHKRHGCKKYKCFLWGYCAQADRCDKEKEEIKRLKIELQKFIDSKEI